MVWALKQAGCIKMANRTKPNTYNLKGKVCPKCGINKKPSAYNLRKYFSFKTKKVVILLDSYCRPCSALKAAKWRKKHPAKYKALYTKRNNLRDLKSRAKKAPKKHGKI